jgi:3-dehydroquinate dehydratase/shikimate dehydrogenase
VAKICLCLTAKTLDRNLEKLRKYRNYADIAELRVDCLSPDERLQIRNFPQQADIPLILTIRRTVDGGNFEGGEGARINLMARGLAFADADRRRNFAYLDIEDDLNVPSLEEAARAFGTRIIRSYHNAKETDSNLVKKIRSMPHSGNDIVKVSVMANSIADVLALLRAGKQCVKQEKILIAMGRYGMCSRILAEHFGSFLSNARAVSETDLSVTAPCQMDIKELAELYRFRTIGAATKVYGVTGYPLTVTGSPQFFNTIFRMEGMDAVYVPFPADSIGSCLELAAELNVCGLSVTVPYKETVIPFLASLSPEVSSIGACNTVIRSPEGWTGINTDARGFSDSLLEFTKKKSLKRQKVTVIGAGGAARAVASELHRMGARVLILNRTILRARELASLYKFAWGGLDSQGIKMMDRYGGIIIQTTSSGMEENRPADPVELYRFRGKEEAMDLIYHPEQTPFLRRAADSGCRVKNGYDMLIRQARYQYAQFTGKEFPDHLLSRVKFEKNQP